MKRKQIKPKSSKVSISVLTPKHKKQFKTDKARQEAIVEVYSIDKTVAVFENEIYILLEQVADKRKKLRDEGYWI